MDESPKTSAPDVLIVDDTPANLQVLAGMLKDQGFRVRPVPGGKLALRAARSEPPDLILLDIMMPEMDGYDVCAELKRDPALSDVPVIFISALTDTVDKVKAFGAGGVDYITKPFQFEEVQARVGVHLRLRGLQLELQSRNRQLQESYNRQRDLEAMRDSLTHMIVHDLRTPLTSIISGLETVIAGGDLDELQGEMLDMALQGGNMLLSMINDLLDVHKMESGVLELERAALDPAQLARACAGQVENLAREKGLELLLEVEEQVPPVAADEEKLRRSLVNLLGNSIKFTNRGSVKLTIHHDPDHGAVRFSVVDTGEGIPQDAFERIFDKFGQVQTRQAGRKMSTGLGLTFVKMVAEAHGGTVGVESELGAGSVFTLDIPAEGERAA